MASPFPIPLNAIRAIEIVGRHHALGPAAEELGVTPGAVSQHIRRAEARLGVLLFERTPQGLRPTEALREIQPLLGSGFGALAEALGRLTSDREGTLTVTVGSVFASRWLVWRLGRFTAAHPEIELRLVVTGAVLDLMRPDIDCAIRYGSGTWPGADAHLLGGDSYAPVAAPGLAARLKKPEDLARVPVIHDTSSMLSWPDWFAEAGVPQPPALSGPTFTDPALAFDAAIAGQAALLAVDLMAMDAVSDGRLVRPFPVFVRSALGYFFVAANGRRLPRKARLFRDWLFAELAAEPRGYAAKA